MPATIDRVDLLPNIHPGELLKEDMDELGITAYRLSKDTGLSPTHVGEILHGERGITAATALILGKYFSNSAEYWINLQALYDMFEAKRAIGNRLDKVVPLSENHQHQDQ